MTPTPRRSPVYILFGPDSYLKHRAVTEIIHATFGHDEGMAGPTRVDGDTAKLADVLDELRTYALLGGRRLVVVDDADEFISRHRAALENYCSAPSATGVFILVCKGSNAQTKLHRAVDKLGGCMKFETPKGPALRSWIIDHARRAYDKRLDNDAVATLREHCDDSLGMLDAELSKLATYVGRRPNITSEDIQALVGQHRSENVFQVTDALAERDAATALAKWQQVLATDRAAPMKAVGGLAWGIRRLLELRQAVDAGASVASLSYQARMPPDLLRRRLQGQSVDRLESQLCDLLQADLDSKTGLGDVESAVEKFLVKYCTAV